MKHLKTLSFFFIIAVLALCIGCGGGKKHYDEEFPENDSDSGENDSDKTDSGEETGDSDTANDDSDTARPDSDTDNGEIIHTDIDSEDDSDEPEDDKDNPKDDSDNHDTPADEDSKDDSDEPGSDDDGSDPVQDDDVIPELPDIDEKEDPNVLCTGQTKCYDMYDEMACPASQGDYFFGQDAQYTAANGYCIKKNFTASGEIVTDNITELVWQRNIPSSYSGCTGNSGALCLHNEAKNYCENLTIGGFDDWRLPTPNELATIIDFGKNSPAADEKFSNPTGSRINFWTSAESLYSTAGDPRIWLVNFTTGAVEEGDNHAKYVRCVRGDELEGPSFSILNEGEAEEIVFDSVHNLHWTKNPAAAVNWRLALSYCVNLEYNGETGWRLPTVNELATILDYSRKAPASEFPTLQTPNLWTSTTYYSGNPEGYNTAWIVYTAKGEIKSAAKDGIAQILCVK